MPVNQKAMDNMKKQYGSEKGERVYYASVNTGKVKEAADKLREDMFPHLKEMKGKK